MPGYKKTYRKKPYAKKTYKKPMKYKVADMAETAFKGVMKLKRLINVEHKYCTTASSTTVSSAGTIINLASIAQGDTDTSRDGDSIKPQTSVLRFNWYNNGSASGNIGRMIIFRGKAENGSSYSTTNILESASWLSAKNHDQRFNTKILYDRTFNLTNSVSGSVQAFPGKVMLKMDGHINYAEASTTIKDGGLYMLLISNDNTNMPSLYYNNVLSYTDN